MSPVSQGNAKEQVRPKLMGKMIGGLIVLAAAAAVGLVARLPIAPRELPPKEAPAVNVQVQVIQAEPALADAFSLPGVVEPHRIVKVSAEVAGRVEKVPCEEGAPCKAGDPLVHLNTDLLKADFDRAAAQADFDAKQCARLAKLYSDKVASDQDRDHAAARKAVSRAALQEARARLDRATILAPVSGILNERFVEEGEYVQPGTLVAEIVDIETVKVVVHVPERDIQFFKTGAETAVLAGPNGEEKEIAGAVTYISELADQRTRTTRMEITVDNRARVLRSGQIVRARLIRRVLKDVILIPLLAVIPLETGHAVYVVEHGKAQRREVRLGFFKGRRVQILAGLSPGDHLIVAGHRLVGPGQRVAIPEEQR